MHFQHAPSLWREFPQLRAGALFCSGISKDADVSDRLGEFYATASSRLASGTESDLPEIQAWRRAFSAMGLKPTQYRCAAESLLRRFRKEGSLPSIHPLIDLCNAISLAYAVPIAVFDLAEVSDFLEVRHAAGDETYLTFSGSVENPAPGEVIFADGAGRAHARRWTNRQSGLSAVRDSTSSVLIVAEAVSEVDLSSLVETLDSSLATLWAGSRSSAVLSAESPRFSF